MQDTFGFPSTYWTDISTFNPQGGKTGLDNQQTKLATYSSSSFTQVCLGVKYNMQTRFIVINKTARSLYSLLSGNIFHPTSLGRNVWKTLYGDEGSLEPYCNSEGFNAACPAPAIRIGIITNDFNVCTSCGAWLAFGAGPYGLWHHASSVSDNGAGDFYGFGYIMVK